MATKGSRLRLALYLFMLTLVFVYGIAVGTYKIFPFEQIKYLKKLTKSSALSQIIKSPTRLCSIIFLPKVMRVMIGDSITQAGIWSEIFPEARILFSSTGCQIDGLDTTADILIRMATLLSVKPNESTGHGRGERHPAIVFGQ